MIEAYEIGTPLACRLDRFPEVAYLGEGCGQRHFAWDLRRVSYDALVEIKTHIEADIDGQVTFTLFDDRWIFTEEMPHGSAALERLAEARVLRESPNVESLKFRAFAMQSDARLKTSIRDVVVSWDRAGRVFTGDLMTDLQKIGLLQHSMLLGLSKDESDLIYRFIGLDFGQHFGRDWPILAIGTTCQDDPEDHDYSKWVFPRYKHVLASEEPERAIIDALSARDTSRSRLKRLNYDRVILPTKLTSGAPAVLMVSQVKHGLCSLAA